MFENIDINDFWDCSSEYDYLKLEPFSEELLRETEKEIGYKYPESYIALLRVQNGGCPKNTKVGKTEWVISGIYGIGKDDNNFWENEGVAYPKIGVPICAEADECSMIFLDYRKCGNDGEPRVVGIDPELNVIDFIAKDFESFINMLVPATDEDNEDDEDSEADGNKFDPYEGVQFTPVEGEQRKELNRIIWKDFPWIVGFTSIWLLIIIVFLFTDNVLLVIIRILSYFPAVYGILGIIGGLVDCISKSKQTYESYVDTVDVIWEANEPIIKPKYGTKKKTIFFRLKKSKIESYLNRYPHIDNYQEGDRVRVYRAKEKKGEVIIAKEQE